MRRTISGLLSACVLLCGIGAFADGTTEYITDISLQERPVQIEEFPEEAPQETFEAFIIEDASITESALDPQSYADLKRGNEGEAVCRLQQRLIQLNYLTDLNVDGVYGASTASAMHDFKRACGIDEEEPHLPDDCPASAEAQAMLFSDAAIPFNDPEFPISIVREAGIHAKEGGSHLVFRPEVKNESRTRTVSSFTIECYATDIWGNRVFDASTDCVWTTVCAVAPGATAQADAMTLPDRIKIARLYARITRVTFTDGVSLTSDAQAYTDWLPVEW